jgi:hypothetical protein
MAQEYIWTCLQHEIFKNININISQQFKNDRAVLSKTYISPVQTLSHRMLIHWNKASFTHHVSQINIS